MAAPNTNFDSRLVFPLGHELTDNHHETGLCEALERVSEMPSLKYISVSRNRQRPQSLIKCHTVRALTDDSVNIRGYARLLRTRHVTFNAPMALFEQAAEIPVIYLKKGQVYLVYAVETVPPAPGRTPVQFHTLVHDYFQGSQTPGNLACKLTSFCY